MFYQHSVYVGTCLWDGSDQPLCQLETQSGCSWLPFWVCVWEMFHIHFSLTEHQCRVQPAAHTKVMEQVHSQLQHDMHILLRIATEYCVSIRILLALPAVLLIKVKNEVGRTSLECDKLIEHVNRHQVSCWIIFSILFWYNFFIILVCLSALIFFVLELLFSNTDLNCAHVWFPFSSPYVTEEHLFSCWFAIVPSNSTLPESEKHFRCLRLDALPYVI